MIINVLHFGMLGYNCQYWEELGTNIKFILDLDFLLKVKKINI